MANKLKIKKGDRVKVITGGSKGKVGDVLRVLPKEQRVVVSGVNMIKRHTKPSRTESGGIIERDGAADDRLSRCRSVRHVECLGADPGERHDALSRARGSQRTLGAQGLLGLFADAAV